MPETSHLVLGMIAIKPHRFSSMAPPRTAADEDTTLARTLVRLARGNAAVDPAASEPTARRFSAPWQWDRLPCRPDRAGTGVVVQADLGRLEGELSAEAERVLRRLLGE